MINPVSRLGMGAMRLPLTEDGGPINEKKARELIEHAHAGGINYFDTAYFYHAGNSERVLGLGLKTFPRNSWHIANKMPGNMMRYENGKLVLAGFNMADKIIGGCAEVFEHQLEQCGVDYFDFYLLHNVSETTFDIYTDEKLDIMGYLLEQKKAGRIRHLGFSTHGRAETIGVFLELQREHGRLDAIKFAMIQLNHHHLKAVGWYTTEVV